MSFKDIQIIAIILLLIVFEGNIARRPNIIDDNMKERRDYRPSKWIANSAMDVWYGNKSMVDIISRELSEIMSRIVDKRVRRSPVSNVTDNPFIPEIDVPETIHLKQFEDKLNAFFESVNLSQRYIRKKGEPIYEEKKK
ncbi:hypothetical protein O0L34_g8807 [Tuta absoluta]|nr:hypothetical protein O0L34_g8807 [Tuta absoluta]